MDYIICTLVTSLTGLAHKLLKPKKFINRLWVLLCICEAAMGGTAVVTHTTHGKVCPVHNGHGGMLCRITGRHGRNEAGATRDALGDGPKPPSLCVIYVLPRPLIPAYYTNVCSF